MGRPKLSREKKLSKMARVKLTESDYHRAVARAKIYGAKSLSEWIRYCIKEPRLKFLRPPK